MSITRLVAAAPVFFLALGLAACGGGQQSSNATETASPAAEMSPNAESTPFEVSASPGESSVASPEAMTSPPPSPGPAETAATPAPAGTPAPVNGLIATYNLRDSAVTNNMEFDVYINGTQVSTITTWGAQSDITTYLHKGANKMRVVWKVTNSSGGGALTVGENYRGHWNTVANFSVNHDNPRGDKTIVINAR